MPCDSQIPAGMTPEQRLEQIRAAVARLEQQLASGAVTVKVGENGAVAFVGWKDRDGVADVCAYRVLTVSRSFALRQAVARAEAFAGRKVNAAAVAAGWHSHDDGATWSTH